MNDYADLLIVQKEDDQWQRDTLMTLPDGIRYQLLNDSVFVFFNEYYRSFESYAYGENGWTKQHESPVSLDSGYPRGIPHYNTSHEKNTFYRTSHHATPANVEKWEWNAENNTWDSTRFAMPEHLSAKYVVNGEFLMEDANNNQYAFYTLNEDRTWTLSSVLYDRKDQLISFDISNDTLIFGIQQSEELVKLLQTYTYEDGMGWRLLNEISEPIGVAYTRNLHSAQLSDGILSYKHPEILANGRSVTTLVFCRWEEEQWKPFQRMNSENTPSYNDQLNYYSLWGDNCVIPSGDGSLLIMELREEATTSFAQDSLSVGIEQEPIALQATTTSDANILFRILEGHAIGELEGNLFTPKRKGEAKIVAYTPTTDTYVYTSDTLHLTVTPKEHTLSFEVAPMETLSFQSLTASSSAGVPVRFRLANHQQDAYIRNDSLFAYRKGAIKVVAYAEDSIYADLEVERTVVVSENTPQDNILYQEEFYVDQTASGNEGNYSIHGGYMAIPNPKDTVVNIYEREDEGWKLTQQLPADRYATEYVKIHGDWLVYPTDNFDLVFYHLEGGKWEYFQRIDKPSGGHSKLTMSENTLVLFKLKNALGDSLYIYEFEYGKWTLKQETAVSYYDYRWWGANLPTTFFMHDQYIVIGSHGEYVAGQIEIYKWENDTLTDYPTFTIADGLVITNGEMFGDQLICTSRYSNPQQKIEIFTLQETGEWASTQTIDKVGDNAVAPVVKISNGELLLTDKSSIYTYTVDGEGRWSFKEKEENVFGKGFKRNEDLVVAGIPGGYSIWNKILDTADDHHLKLFTRKYTAPITGRDSAQVSLSEVDTVMLAYTHPQQGSLYYQIQEGHDLAELNGDTLHLSGRGVVKLHVGVTASDLYGAAEKEVVVHITGEQRALSLQTPTQMTAGEYFVLPTQTDAGDNIYYRVENSSGSIQQDTLYALSRGSIKLQAYLLGNNTQEPVSLQKSIEVQDPDNSELKWFILGEGIVDETGKVYPYEFRIDGDHFLVRKGVDYSAYTQVDFYHWEKGNWSLSDTLHYITDEKGKRRMLMDLSGNRTILVTHTSEDEFWWTEQLLELEYINGEWAVTDSTLLMEDVRGHMLVQDVSMEGDLLLLKRGTEYPDNPVFELKRKEEKGWVDLVSMSREELSEFIPLAREEYSTLLDKVNLKGNHFLVTVSHIHDQYRKAVQLFELQEDNSLQPVGKTIEGNIVGEHIQSKDTVFCSSGEGLIRYTYQQLDSSWLPIDTLGVPAYAYKGQNPVIGTVAFTGDKVWTSVHPNYQAPSTLYRYDIGQEFVLTDSIFFDYEVNTLQTWGDRLVTFDGKSGYQPGDKVTFFEEKIPTYITGLRDTTVTYGIEEITWEPSTNSTADFSVALISADTAIRFLNAQQTKVIGRGKGILKAAVPANELYVGTDTTVEVTVKGWYDTLNIQAPDTLLRWETGEVSATSTQSFPIYYQVKKDDSPAVMMSKNTFMGIDAGEVNVVAKHYGNHIYYPAEVEQKVMIKNVSESLDYRRVQILDVPYSSYYATMGVFDNKLYVMNYDSIHIYHWDSLGYGWGDKSSIGLTLRRDGEVLLGDQLIIPQYYYSSYSENPLQFYRLENDVWSPKDVEVSTSKIADANPSHSFVITGSYVMAMSTNYPNTQISVLGYKNGRYTTAQEFIIPEYTSTDLPSKIAGAYHFIIPERNNYALTLKDGQWVETSIEDELPEAADYARISGDQLMFVKLNSSIKVLEIFTYAYDKEANVWKKSTTFTDAQIPLEIQNFYGVQVALQRNRILIGNTDYNMIKGYERRSSEWKEILHLENTDIRRNSIFNWFGNRIVFEKDYGQDLMFYEERIVPEFSFLQDTIEVTENVLDLDTLIRHNQEYPSIVYEVLDNSTSISIDGNVAAFQATGETVEVEAFLAPSMSTFSAKDTVAFNMEYVLSTEDSFSEQNVQGYPVPLKDYLFLKGVEETTKYLLFRMNGKVIKEDQYDSRKGIEVSGLAKGVYILKLYHHGNVLSIKLVK
ncbi:hypothetical protein GCM10023331_06200 [Algivirga pacifica]|uniref:Por secretion system C-terminal sorting domain-containing protein n=2 Tax=Algivirga pacifica TaxID=1162670 RepID=A0ABP9D623_9BACT